VLPVRHEPPPSREGTQHFFLAVELNHSQVLPSNIHAAKINLIQHGKTPHQNEQEEIQDFAAHFYVVSSILCQLPGIGKDPEAYLGH
jgi:hypothetical protein